MRGGSSSLVEIGLQPGETVTFTIVGDCMPGLATRARVRRQRIYLPGDIVVVRRRDYFDAHRFLGYAPSTRGLVAITQADDSEQADPAAVTRAVVGRVEHRVSLADRLSSLRRFGSALRRRLVEVTG